MRKADAVLLCFSRCYDLTLYLSTDLGIRYAGIDTALSERSFAAPERAGIENPRAPTGPDEKDDP